MNINTGMVQMLNVTGKGDMSCEKTGQSESLISFRNILAEKLNEKGTTSFKGEVSEKTLADNENDVKELLSDPFFYFAAQFGFLDNLKNFIKNDGNTIEASSGEETVNKVVLSDNSMSFNNNLTELLAELQNNGSTNNEMTELLATLQNNDSANKNLTDILKALQTDGAMNKEVSRMFTELQNNGSINKELTDMLTELQTNSSENMDIAPPPAEFRNNGSMNKEMTDILTALQTGSSINKELTGIISKSGNDNSISSVEENIPLPETQNPSGPVHIFSETILKDNIMSSKDFKDLLGKVSQSLKDLINSAGTSEKLPDTVSSIKELLSELLASGDTLKDIIKKSDYRDLEGIIAKSPFLAKIQDLLNLFDRNTETPDKKKDLSDIVSEANSIVSSLEQAVKKHSEKDTEYKVTDTSGKEEKDLFLIQQKTLENITYTRLHPEHAKNMSETKREIMSVDLSSQIVKKIDWKSTDKNSMATITLEPESLGKMRVEVNLAVTGEVSARFITQNKQAGEILSEQLNQLKQSLSEQGLKLGNFSVSTEDRSSPGFQQYMPDFNEKKYVASIKNDKEDYSIQLNNKITTSQMDYFV
ncbi:MAG: flagellar hook-length control protein FliK [Candidatus Eremiobacterota bacterium]